MYLNFAKDGRSETEKIQNSAYFDIIEELQATRARLVVVEIYATWCKPCVEAVPQWKTLHERYSDKGLRL